MYTYQYPRPAVTTDIVIFTIRNKQLKLLLIKRSRNPFKGLWALPGGFLKMDEDLDESARRKLQDEAGISGVYLEQLSTFGTPDRDPRGRVLSVAYYALIPSDRIEIRAAANAEAVGWFGLSEVSELAFDHPIIIEKALERLIAKLDYSTIAFQFMADQFTLGELQEVYEIILRQKLDKRNFRKRINAMDSLEQTELERRNGAHRPAKLYRVKQRNKVEIIK